eukprot:8224073-Pyramimonas_sp.AAC.1
MNDFAILPDLENITGISIWVKLDPNQEAGTRYLVDARYNLLAGDVSTMQGFVSSIHMQFPIHNRTSLMSQNLKPTY